MIKRNNLIKIILTIVIILSAISLFVFKDFIIAKNDIFEKTGTKIQLDCRYETKITKNIFEIRKIQNYIEKVEKEPYVEKKNVKGWKYKGYILVDGKVHHILIRGNFLIIEENTYKVTDKNFQQKMVEYYEGIKYCVNNRP